MVPRMNRLFLLAAALALSGCDCGSAVVKPPGDQVLGVFDFKAKGIFAACGLRTPAAEFGFVGTFSRFRDGGPVFFSDGVSRYDAGFDGQLASFEKSERGGFALLDGGACTGCELRTVQVGNIMLLSQSQSLAVGDACPTNALDGGVPGADDAGTITLPRALDDGGFDAVRACGEVVIQVTGEGFCDSACYSCRLHYRWNGVLKN